MTATTKRWIGGKDLALLYRDIADWKCSKSIKADIHQSSQALGPSLRAVTSMPPMALLEDVRAVYNA